MLQPEQTTAQTFPRRSATNGMPEQLTFVIYPVDELSSLDLLVKSLEDIKRLLRHVDHAIYRRATQREREWVVHSIRSSAPTITVAPSPEHLQAVEILGDGLRLLTGGTDQPPQHFTEPVLEDLKRMRRLFRGRGGAESLDVLVDDKPTATIGRDIEKQADRVLSAGYRNLGSIQGELDAITVHRARTATIWDRVSGTPVRWSFSREETDSIKALLERLVSVTGDIRYFSNGTPRSITNVVAFEEISVVEHSHKAGFGSIPDRMVQELGVVRWLESVRGTEQ